MCETREHASLACKSCVSYVLLVLLVLFVSLVCARTAPFRVRPLEPMHIMARRARFQGDGTPIAVGDAGCAKRANMRVWRASRVFRTFCWFCLFCLFRLSARERRHSASAHLSPCTSWHGEHASKATARRSQLETLDVRNARTCEFGVQVVCFVRSAGFACFVCFACLRENGAIPRPPT